MAKLTKTKIKKAIPDSGGVISLIAERCGVTWHTVDKFIKKNEDIGLLYQAELESVLDLGESRLYEAVDRCEPWAVSLLLKTKAKSRGYVEKQEVDTNGKVKITVVNNLEN